MASYEKWAKAQLITELQRLDANRASLANQSQQQAETHKLNVYQIELEIQNQELRETQQELEEARDHYADLYDFAPVGYVTFDQQGVIEEINLTGASWLDQPRAQLKGRPFSHWVEEKSLPLFFKHLQRAFQTKKSEPVVDEVALRCSRSRLREVLLESVPIVDKHGAVLACRSALMDISERKRNERTHRLAYYDQLTGLPNRLLLEDRLTQAINNSQRDKTLVAVLFLDLDRFKNINDSLGHAAGDLVLQEMARRMQKSVRKIDTVARMSGDEFILVLPDISDTGNVLSIANHIIQTTTTPYDADGNLLAVSASIGISIYPNDAADIRSLITSADSAMYHAKKKGRNQFQFYTEEMNKSALEALALENRVRNALRHNQFEVHYQPQVDIISGRVVGLEALLRWHDPVNGWVSPEKVISLAEDRGLIEPIFEWVLRTACEQNYSWQKAGLTALPVSVNICAWQIRQQGLIKKIIHALDDSGLDARFLELELTESMLMQDAEATIAMVHEIQKIGMKLSIDDFGTGYSSLSYLQQLPIHKLKIARPFIADVTSNPDAAVITSAIIGLAKNLKLRALAEGVETVEQLAFLKSRHCDEIQGFYFSEALSPDQCAELLHNDRRLIH